MIFQTDTIERALSIKNIESGRKIAVVGTGIAGLASAWLLSAKHHVDLYESNDYLGGHTNTMDISIDGLDFPVDTGFMVCNRRTYPNFTKMLRHLSVDLQPSNMSFSVQCRSEGLEWAGRNLNTIFAQRANAFKPRFLRMLSDIWRFSRSADRLLSEAEAGEMTLGDLLDAEKFSAGFREWFLVPMGAAIWSVPTEKMLNFPAHAFLRFADNHGLLRLGNKPQWYTIAGGARTYVRKLTKQISGQVCTQSQVKLVKRHNDQVQLEIAGSEKSEPYDAVVLACHADDALGLLAEPSDREREMLLSFPYQQNIAYLHTDTDFLPTTKRAISSWNYRAENCGQGARLSMTYNLNMLQNLACQTVVMVTLNPAREPKPATVLKKMDFAHPVFTKLSLARQRAIPEIQGFKNTWYAGAWQRYGFHEDGLLSAINVAKNFGISPPWALAEPGDL